MKDNATLGIMNDISRLQRTSRFGGQRALSLVLQSEDTQMRACGTKRR